MLIQYDHKSVIKITLQDISGRKIREGQTETRISRFSPSPGGGDTHRIWDGRPGG